MIFEEEEICFKISIIAHKFWEIGNFPVYLSIKSQLCHVDYNNKRNDVLAEKKYLNY